MTTHTADLIDELHAVRPMGRALWQALGRGETREALALRIHTTRLLTADRCTRQLAVLIVLTHMVHLGVRPSEHVMYGFDIFDRDGAPVDVADAPARLVTRMRMLAACANGELETAAALFDAYVTAYPYDVTDFLVDAALHVHRDAAR